MSASDTGAPSQLRRYYPVAVVVVLLLMGFASTLLPHTLAAFGLSLVTASVLLLSAEAFEALLAPVVTKELRQFWRCVYAGFVIVLIITCLAGIFFMLYGALQGELHTSGTSSQYHFVLGVALVAIVVFALVPIWLARATLGMVSVKATRPKWTLLVGSLLFISGTLLQFIALAQS